LDFSTDTLGKPREIPDKCQKRVYRDRKQYGISLLSRFGSLRLEELIYFHIASTGGNPPVYRFMFCFLEGLRARFKLCRSPENGIQGPAELHADFFSAMLVLWEFMFLWRSRIEVKMLCPTRFVVDSMESSKKGGRVAEVCSSQTGL